MISSTVEDYLKAMLKMEDMKQRASTSTVARHLAVADATVTDMLRKLQKAGLLEYKPYYGATLTLEGRRVAVEILRRHRLIELFLHEVMGYGWDQVHDEAEKLEHVVSDFFVERLDVLLGHPTKDPHGEVIPDAEGYREADDDVCLMDSELGEYAVRRVSNDDPDFLAYLQKERLVPGAVISLLDRAPFQGPLKLQIKGNSDPIYIGIEAAKNIHVSSTEPQRQARVTRSSKSSTSAQRKPNERQVSSALAKVVPASRRTKVPTEEGKSS